MATRGSDRWRNQKWGEPCPRTLTTIAFGPTRITVHTASVEAFTALATVLDHHNYPIRKKDTGAYNCRHMRNDPKAPMSSHSWGTAVDVNWQSNPAGKTFKSDMPKEMVEDAMRIKTRSGHRVFRWGGDWDNDWRTEHSYYDAMHYELFVTKEELATGIDWSTVAGTAEELTVITYLLYSKRGTVDGDSMRAAEGAAPVKGMSVTSDLDTAREAVSQGVPVVALGGPACRELNPSVPKGKEGIYTFDNLVCIQGSNAARSMRMIADYADNGWKQ